MSRIHKFDKLEVIELSDESQHISLLVLLLELCTLGKSPSRGTVEVLGDDRPVPDVVA